MIKLITIDLDGTLLTDDKQLPPDFFELAHELLRQDVALVIATGRPLHNVSMLFEKLNGKIFFACDNGTYVVRGDREILVNPLPPAAVGELIGTARKLERVYPVLCGKDIAYIEHDDPEFMEKALKYYREYKIVDDLTTVGELILKISFCDLAGAETNSYPFYRHFEERFSIAVSGEIWLDVTCKSGTKGNAIRIIQESMNVTAAETLAFGDYLNDLEMLRNAGQSFAMKNAHPKILKTASQVTKLTNNEFGVTETIKELFSL